MPKNFLIPKWIHNFYFKHAPDAVKDPYAPNHWKEKILYFLILVTIFLGFFVLLIPGIYLNNQNDNNLITVIGLGCYLGAIIIFLIPKSRFWIRAALACILVYVHGAMIVISLGPFLATREWLFTFCIIASMLLGWVGAIVSIVLNLFTWTVIGLLIYWDFWQDLLKLSNPLTLWYLIAQDLIFINISTTLFITLFFERIEKSDQTAKTYSQLVLKEGHKLSESNRKLEAEIEDRKKITQALRKSEEKYRTILETIQDSYFEVDLNGNLTFFNKALTQRLEYDQDELMGMNYRIYTDEKNAEKLFHVFNNIYTTKKSSEVFDFEVISKNKNIMICGILVSLILDSNENPIGFQGIARDVTEQKKLETQLRRAQKMEALGTLAGGVAHDLNNTLSGVVNYPELILANMAENDPLRKSVLGIKKSGQKAVAIVQDLLSLARRGVANKEVMNLNLIVMEYLQSTEFQALKSFHPKVTIETCLEKPLLNIYGSPVQISKAVMNLISNAVEAIGDSGTVIISTENRHIDTCVSRYDIIEDGDYVVLTVEDTGEGIAPNDLDKIFEPFFTTKIMGRSGTGLGMAVVWGTVRDHHGHIDVQSNEGQGSVFSIYFPISREEITHLPPMPSVENFKGNGEAILVVDDVETQRDIATDMLKLLGYKVTSVKSGEKAVAYLQTQKADLIVLDMIMKPGIDGLETYRRILQINPSQKAIIASGYSETEKVKKAMELGAGKYLRKPYSLEAIGRAIRDELSSPSHGK